MLRQGGYSMIATVCMFLRFDAGQIELRRDALDTSADNEDIQLVAARWWPPVGEHLLLTRAVIRLVATIFDLAQQ
jgi:hypothetical protein